MIDRKALLSDLKKLVSSLERDLRGRCEENADVDAGVREEYERAKEAKRAAQAYKVWRDEWITQVAVAWVLGVVFVRFIEDNELIPAPFIAGRASACSSGRSSGRRSSSRTRRSRIASTSSTSSAWWRSSRR